MTADMPELAAMAQGVVQVHGAAAGDHKNAVDAGTHQVLSYVIGNADGPHFP
jgi:hypothetical protein